jgi:hypothetical protein
LRRRDGGVVSITIPDGRAKYLIHRVGARVDMIHGLRPRDTLHLFGRYDRLPRRGRECDKIMSELKHMAASDPHGVWEVRKE